MNTQRRHQRGAHTVEFAITAGVFFFMLFAVIEFGRLLYTWQTLDEASRRAARIAVVCPVGDPAIRHVAVFNSPGTAGESALLPGLLDTHVVIDYQNQSGTTLADPMASFDDIRFVRASISGYTHRLLIPNLLLIPGFGEPFAFPDIETVLPRESLGVSPEGTGCLGTYM